MDPASYVKVLERRWVVIAVSAVLGMCAGWVTTPSTPPPAKPIKEYRAAATMLNAPAAPGATGAQTVGGLAFLSVTGEVPRRVARKLGYEGEPAVLAAQVTAGSDEKLNTLKFSTVGPDGPRVAALANAFATELLAFLEERAIANRQQQVTDSMTRMSDLQAGILQRDGKIATGGAGTAVDLLKAERDALIRQYSLAYDRLTQVQALPPPTAGLFLFEEATPIPVFKSTAFRPPSSHAGRVGIGAVVGLIVGIGIAFAIERFNGLLYSKESAEDAFSLPVIAELPDSRRSESARFEIDVVREPGSDEADAYRRLRTSIMLMRVLRPVPTDQNGNGHGIENGATAQPLSFVGGAPGVALGAPGVILVSSAGPGEGKTRACANLAASFGLSGASVLVIDCDFGAPQVHRYFGVSQGRGLANVIANTPGGDPRTVLQASSVPGVSVIGAGTFGHAHPELSAHAQDLIAQARRLADVVIIDSSPLLGTSEPREIAPFVDAVLVVARVGRTSVKAARKTSELLGRLGAPVLGVTLAGTRAERGYRSQSTWRDRRRSRGSTNGRAQPTTQTEPGLEAETQVQPAPALATTPAVEVRSPQAGHEANGKHPGSADGQTTSRWSNPQAPTPRVLLGEGVTPAEPTSAVPPPSPRRPLTRRWTPASPAIEPVDE